MTCAASRRSTTWIALFLQLAIRFTIVTSDFLPPPRLERISLLHLCSVPLFLKTDEILLRNLLCLRADRLRLLLFSTAFENDQFGISVYQASSLDSLRRSRAQNLIFSLFSFVSSRISTDFFFASKPKYPLRAFADVRIYSAFLGIELPASQCLTSQIAQTEPAKA